MVYLVLTYASSTSFFGVNKVFTSEKKAEEHAKKLKKEKGYYSVYIERHKVDNEQAK